MFWRGGAGRFGGAVGRRHALGSRGSRRRRRRAEPAWPHEMVGHLVRNAAEALGHPPQPIVSLGGTDTRLWRRAGDPAVVYGCSPAGMGGIDESVKIAGFHWVPGVLRACGR